MNRREIARMGRTRGYNIASWQDLPEIGAEIPKHVDWVGYGKVSKENIRDVWELLCAEAESNSRQFSPFEFTAKELNDLAETKPYDPWEVYDSALQKGYARYWSAHYSRHARRKLNRLTRAPFGA